MTTIKRNDKTGNTRGAGPYSRSYLKTTDKPAPGFAKHYPQGEFAGEATPHYRNRGAAPRVQDLIRGKDISARVDAHAEMTTGGSNWVDGSSGFSGPVGSNRRPAHRAAAAKNYGVDDDRTGRNPGSNRRYKDWV